MTESLMFKSEDALRIGTRELSENSNLPQNMSTSAEIETPESTLPSTTLSSEFIMQTTIHNGTDYTGSSTTTHWTTSAPHQNGSSGTAMVIIIAVLVVSAALILIYFCLKKGKFFKFPCYIPITRARRSSSSSSRRALEEHEVMEEQYRPKPEGQSDDMFTIDDENNAEPTGGREEYYYDEVFGQSQFEDEATNNAMRQLYSDSDVVPEEEILDLDFETLGIKIEDYSPDPVRKNTI